MNIFGLYGVVKEIFQPTGLGLIALTANLAAIVNDLVNQTIVVFFGNRLTLEAKKTEKVFSKFMASSEFDETQRSEFVYLLTQMRSRKTTVENFLFKLDWKTFIAVSLLRVP